MTAEYANPPRWAVLLLDRLLAPQDRSTIAGDLLEEYRDARIDALGRRGADRWYVRQVASIWWRLSAPWGVAFAIAATIRMLFDVFAPPPLTGWGPRSAASTWAAISLRLAAGCYAAWKTGQVSTGVLTTAAATAIGFLLGQMATALATGLTFDTNNPAGRLEDFALIPIVLVVTVILGFAGGLVGVALRYASRMRSTR